MTESKRLYNLQRPPLPFKGNKMRWWRELGLLARALPYGACVCDAFGGSMSTARLVKDARPDLTVITNDFMHAYRKRLSVIDDTIAIYKLLAHEVGCRKFGSGVWERFESQEKERKAMSIVSTALDNETAWGWIHGRGCVLNKIPMTCPILPQVCNSWLDGLVVVDEELCLKKAKIWAKSGAFIILDPPYEKTQIAGWKKTCEYYGDFDAAREFCEEIVKTAPAWCIFERKGSRLYKIAHEITAWAKTDPVDVYREMYTSCPNHVRDEVMVVHGVDLKNLDNT